MHRTTGWRRAVTRHSRGRVNRWKSHLLAVDGSTESLHRTPELLQQYGVAKNQYGDYPTAWISVLNDALKSLIYILLQHPYGTSERQVVGRFIGNLPQGSLVLLDRGYPSSALFQHLHP